MSQSGWVIQSAECKVQNTQVECKKKECKIQSTECKLQNHRVLVQSHVQSASAGTECRECRVQECRVQSAQSANYRVQKQSHKNTSAENASASTECRV
jgi:hypothetical protein